MNERLSTVQIDTLWMYEEGTIVGHLPRDLTSVFAVPSTGRYYSLYINYFAGLFIRCRKYFASLIIRCTKYFAKFIFVALNDYENILTTKISRFTVSSCSGHGKIIKGRG